MNLNINFNNIPDAIRDRLQTKLESYERHSAILRGRLNGGWNVNVRREASVSGAWNGTAVTVTLPVREPYERHPEMIDHISECAEAIMFECGNAETNLLMTGVKTHVTNNVVASLMAAGEEKARIEAGQMQEYCTGLRQAVARVALSPQAKRDMAAGLAPGYMNNFLTTPHDANSANLKLRLFPPQLYALGLVEEADGAFLKDILRGMVRQGAEAAGFGLSIAALNAAALDHLPPVSVYDGVAKIVSAIGAGGGWQMGAGYVFTPAMQNFVPQNMPMGARGAVEAWVTDVRTRGLAVAGAIPNATMTRTLLT